MAGFDVPDGAVVQAYRFALDPTPAQVRAFWSHVGAVRKAYNTMLGLVKAVISQRAAERSYGIGEEDLTPSLGWSLAALRREWNRRKETVAPWWAENSKEAYNTGLDRLARALDAWSKSREGERAGRRAGFPRFKSIGRGVRSVGVDVGVKAGALLVVAAPDGRELDRVPAPKPLAAAKTRLRILQRRAARQQGPYDSSSRSARRPSKRWQATQRKIGRAYAGAAAVRRDVLQKATTILAQRHQVITVETLNASGMRSKGGARKRGLNRALADAALAEVRRMLGYKTQWYGSVLVEADRFFPSSKLCAGCGRRKPNLKLADRTFVCEHCGLRIDRDLNAAINLARLGDTQLSGGTGTGTGSRPAANQTGNGRVGDGRGATQKTQPAQAGKAAGREASTRHNTVGQTGTVPPEGEAA